MKSTKKPAAKSMPRLSSPANVKRVGALLQEELYAPHPDHEHGCELAEWFDQLMSDAGPHLDDPDIFRIVFPRAARRVERKTTSGRAVGAVQAYRVIQNILRRTAAGETLAEIRAERHAAMKASGERYRAEQLAKPEPKDKTSDEWRYWKLRHVEADLESGDAEREARALAEFWRFFDAFKNAAGVRLYDVRQLIPHLIIAWQDAQKGKRKRTA